MLSKLDLDPKCQGHSTNQKLMTWGTKNTEKNLSRRSLSNWCDADEDADSSKTICRPPPYGAVAIISNIKCKVQLASNLNYDLSYLTLLACYV